MLLNPCAPHAGRVSAHLSVESWSVESWCLLLDALEPWHSPMLGRAGADWPTTRAQWAAKPLLAADVSARRRPRLAIYWSLGRRRLIPSPLSATLGACSHPPQARRLCLCVPVLTASVAPGSLPCPAGPARPASPRSSSRSFRVPPPWPSKSRRPALQLLLFRGRLGAAPRGAEWPTAARAGWLAGWR